MKTILKITGSLHFLLPVLLISMLVFSVETIFLSVLPETLLYFKGFDDVVDACNLSLGFSLIISISIRDLHAAKKIFRWVGLNVLIINSCCLQHNKCRHYCWCWFTSTFLDCSNRRFFLCPLYCWKVRIVDQMKFVLLYGGKYIPNN